MKTPESNGRGPPVRTDPATTGSESLDPLIEAEALRTALVEAASCASRLVQSLKHYKRERRALSSAWSSLKSLRLGGGGP
jgi:hypothetical protein